MSLFRRKISRLAARIRHARHLLKGWRKWLIIMAQATAGLVALFAVVNLVLSLSTFRGENPLERTVLEVQVLWFSPVDGSPIAPDAFSAVYRDVLGPVPELDAIHAHLAREAADGVFVLDHLMVNRILALNGRIDARALPSGVYVGAHALGPDGYPFVPVTKFLAHYLLFARHSYILVVPEEGAAIVFSASQNAKFGIEDDPDRLAAEITVYGPAAYDFPSSGQAIHEMTRIISDPAGVAQAEATLRRAEARLEAEGLRYGLLAPNSNTVIGCLLERTDVVTRDERSSILLALRAPGFGADCG